MAKIPRSEFKGRIDRIKNRMVREGFDALIVYGDEYRRENVRYVSNYWPIFERAAVLISPDSEPILLVAPEGREIAREMSVWSDVRFLREMQCVSVPEEISYTAVKHTTFADVFKDILPSGKTRKVGIVGISDIPKTVYSSLQESLPGVDLQDSGQLLFEMRIIKSESEIECLAEAAKIGDIGYEQLMSRALPGTTELEAAAAGEGAARAAGAEAIAFTIFGTGKRSDMIIPRPSNKVIKRGDMVVAGLAVQYEGYITTAQFPFVAGRKPTKEQKLLFDVIVNAESKGLEKLKPDVPAREFVKAVRGYFKEKSLLQYTAYTPLHGCGLAEAESPYPDERIR